MMKKIVLKYILMYIPFIVGIMLYSFNIYNLFSSLLLFVGGYIALKNTLDYRRVNKNIVKENDNSFKRNVINVDNKRVINVKKIKRNIRVRKRVKY